MGTKGAKHKKTCAAFVVHLGINNPPVCHSSETSNLLSNGPQIPRFARNDKLKTSAGRVTSHCTSRIFNGLLRPKLVLAGKFWPADGEGIG